MTSRSIAIIEELQNFASRSGNKLLERRLADLSVWFYQNKQRIPPENLLVRQAFMEKALWTMVEVQALLLERIQEMEHARKSGKSSLWLPGGMKVNGDVTLS